MSVLSEERMSHWSHLITDGIYNDDLADYTDDDQVLRTTKRALAAFVAEENAMVEAAKSKVASLKRGVMEGTPEWEIMFKKYYEEERGRHGQK